MDLKAQYEIHIEYESPLRRKQTPISVANLRCHIWPTSYPTLVPCTTQPSWPVQLSDLTNHFRVSCFCCFQVFQHTNWKVLGSFRCEKWQTLPKVQIFKHQRSLNHLFIGESGPGVDRWNEYEMILWNDMFSLDTTVNSKTLDSKTFWMLKSNNSCMSAPHEDTAGRTFLGSQHQLISFCCGKQSGASTRHGRHGEATLGTRYLQHQYLGMGWAGYDNLFLHKLSAITSDFKVQMGHHLNPDAGWRFRSDSKSEKC